MAGSDAKVTGRRTVALPLLLTGLLLSGFVQAPSAAALAPGTPYTWGGNQYGQLGDGSTAPHLNPQAVSVLSDAIDIGGGREHAIALRPDGTVRTWGRNNLGQIGDGSSSMRLVPTIVPGLAGCIDVAAGHDHNLALLSDGTVRSWGYNAFGQLGDGSVTNRRTPVLVSGLTSVVAIAGGRDMSYALLADGTLRAWGLNTSGQIGDGTTTNRRTPVAVGGLTNVESMAGGRDHGLAVRSDGTVWAWGDNAYGQLGIGNTVDRTSPVQVPGLAGVVAVAAGAFHSVALLSDGTVRAWGRNQLGQLGNGTTTNRSTPSVVTSLSDVVSVGTGRDHTLAILQDGSVRSWGQNDFGQLGDGTTTIRTSPVTVGGLSGATAVHGGREYSIALVTQGPPDTTDPSAPGQPSGQSTTPGTIDLTWPAATDDVSTTLTYRVFRDGAFAGSTTSSLPVVDFSDVGLQGGDQHVYTVTAVDAAANEGPASPPSDPITVVSGPPLIFADDFSSGTLANWNAVTRFAIDGAAGGMAPPSARASVSGLSATMVRSLGASYSSVCVSARVNMSARTGSVILWRLRTAADGPVSRALVNASGILAIRSDVSGVTQASGVALGTGWHAIELCGTVGTAGAWSLYRDGVAVLSSWSANTGTVPVGMVELGNSNAGTWTANFDDVQVDQTAG